MKTRSATLLVARAALVVPLLVGAMGGSALGAGGKRAGVPKFDGAQEVVVRKQVMKVLKAHGYELAKSREMDLGLANTGALLESDDGFAKVAKELALSVIVTGEIGRKRAKITVHDGRDGSGWARRRSRARTRARWRRRWRARSGASSAGKSNAAACRRARRRRRRPWRRPRTTTKARPMRLTRPSPKPSSPRVATHRRVQASPDGADDSGSRPDKDDEANDNVLREEASAAASPPGPCRRRSTRSSRRPARTAPSSTIRMSARWACAPTRCRSPPRRPCTSSGTRSAPCPAARYNTSASRLPSSKRSACDPPPADGSALAGRTFGNSVHDYAAGLRYRIPFGAGHQVWISGTAGEHAFVFTSPSDCGDCRAMLHIPDTIYRYGRPGIGLRLEMPGDLSLTLGGGYRYIFNAGGTHLDGYFPHRTVGGVDAELALGHRVTSSLEIRGSGPGTPLLLRHAFEGGRHLYRRRRDRSSTGRSASGWRFCWAAAMRPPGSEGVHAAPMITGERRDRCRPWFIRTVAQR